MSRRRRTSENTLRLPIQNEEQTPGVQIFRVDQDLDDNAQAVSVNSSAISHSIANPITESNLSGFQMIRANGQKLSSSIRPETTTNIIQCQICENSDTNLIQPCQCENFYHSYCFKQKLIAAHPKFQLEDLQCQLCNVTYKIKRINQQNFAGFTRTDLIVSTIVKFVFVLGGIAVLSYWLDVIIKNKDTDQDSFSSLLAIAILLILLNILYLIYLVLQLFRNNQIADWEIVDQKQNIDLIVGAEEINQIIYEEESRQKKSRAQQLTSVYPEAISPQINTINTNGQIQI